MRKTRERQRSDTMEMGEWWDLCLWIDLAGAIVHGYLRERRVLLDWQADQGRVGE